MWDQHDWNHEQLHVAANAAVACWFTPDGEGQLAAAIQADGPLAADTFKAWLIKWMVARNSLLRHRTDLLTFLNEHARPAFLAGEHQGPVLVEHLRDQVQAFTHGRPTSLMSKFAFSCCPTIYAPYDRRARSALRVLHFVVPDHNYGPYMGAFTAVRESVAAALVDIHITLEAVMDDLGINQGNYPPNQPPMDQALFEMRTTDKFLMLLGGFPAGQL